MTAVAQPDLDLFALESAALAHAQAAYADPQADARAALAALIGQYQRMMRESRRLIRRSDRAELEMNQLNRRLHQLTTQLEYRASHDPLTGALNRGAVIEHASACLARGDMALIVLDIDHFKRVNDDFGHPTGDAVIQSVVHCLQQLLGSDASIGRVGGEEFSVVWPTSSAEQAQALGRRICLAIATQVFAAPIDRQITASVGVSWNPAGTSFETAYGQADEALYGAKRSGRNCVRLYQPCGDGVPSLPYSGSLRLTPIQPIVSTLRR
jgi:diguanylate cyclase (GGDEF)-like protein